VAFATRGPAVTISLPARTTTRRLPTAGIDGHDIPRFQVRRGLIVRTQLDDDLGGARDELLGRRLHRLARDVAEDVLAAGDVEHVVQEADATAGVQVPQRARFVTKHQQRAGPRPARHLRADRVERCAERRHHTLRAVRVARRRAQRSQRLQDVGEPAVHVAEPRDAGTFELLREVALRAVDDDQFRPLATGSSRRRDRAARRRSEACAPPPVHDRNC
jgi:hypothetical protein